MAEAEAIKKPAAVNPILIIVLVVALGGAAYFQFFMNPVPKPPPAPVTISPTNPVVSPAELVKETTTTAATATEPNPNPAEPVVSDRDPFRPSGTSVTSKPGSGTNQNLSFAPEPLWKGTIKTKDGQVAIVNYQGKSHLLRIGDQLPGSAYRLREINQDSILLTSPKKTLRLSKNEEAK